MIKETILSISKAAAPRIIEKIRKEDKKTRKYFMLMYYFSENKASNSKLDRILESFVFIFYVLYLVHYEK